MKPSSPTPETIKSVRVQHGLLPKDAAALIYRTARNWQQFEAGTRKMDIALWELFQLKLNLLKKDG